jgi:hypothetical protein
MFSGQLAKGALDIVRGGTLGDTQSLIIIAELSCHVLEKLKVKSGMRKVEKQIG